MGVAYYEERAVGGLSAILDDPALDLPRLRFADLLDDWAEWEPGRAEPFRAHAALIRKQVECSLRACAACKKFLSSPPAPGHRVDEERVERWCACGAPSAYREAAELADTSVDAQSESGACVRLILRDWIWRTLPTPNFTRVELCRGFVDAVGIRVADFARHAADLFRAHPVIKVYLTDIRPTHVAGHSLPGSTRYYSFYSESAKKWSPRIDRENTIPDDLYGFYCRHCSVKRMEADPSPAAARLSLLRACFAYGRHKAGLPYREPGLYLPEPELVHASADEPDGA